MSDDKTFIRHHHRVGGGYSIVMNDVARTIPSTDAVAIYVRLWSHTDGWEFTIKSIAAEWDISPKRAEAALKLLRDRAYMHWHRVSAGRGKWSTWYDLTDVPIEDCAAPSCVDCATRRKQELSDGRFTSSEKRPLETTRQDDLSVTGLSLVSSSGFSSVDNRLRKELEDHQLLEDQRSRDSASRSSIAGATEIGDEFWAPQEPSPPAAKEPPELTPGQILNKRAQALAREYVAEVPLASFPAVMSLIKRALKADTYDDEVIEQAVRNLANRRMGMTLNTLRIAIEEQQPRDGVREVSYHQW